MISLCTNGSSYDNPQTSRRTCGVFEGEYVAGGEVKATPMLLPVDVNNADMDASDADNGLLIAPYVTSLLCCVVLLCQRTGGAYARRFRELFHA